MLTNGEAKDPWDDEHLRERKPAGMSPGTFLVVIAVIAMLLAVNLYALLTLVKLPGEGDGKPPEGPPEHPWNQTIEAQVIEGEVVWEERKGHLDAPVVVPSGAKLTLRNCDLDLSTLDLIWNRVPYFHVEVGGELEVEESRIRLNHDPALDETFMGPTYSEYYLPYISRVVNLDGTRDPRVEFELRWRWEGTEIAVGVQPTPESDIRHLHTIVSEQASNSYWTDFQFSLSEYALMTPRVVLYFPTPPEDVVLISRLRVTDGGEDLPHDLPYTGVNQVGGWDNMGFVSFDNVFIWYGHNSTIIDLRGRARITDSILMASPNLMRRGVSNYVKQELETDSYYDRNIRAATRDWYVWVGGGEIILEDTLLFDVPLLASDSRVEIRDCEFEMGLDMVTLYNSTGNITRTRFQGSDPGPLRWWSEKSRPLWAVSIENNTDLGPVTITGCDFDDVPVAVDTGFAWVVLEGNTFTNVSQLAVWSHRSRGMVWVDFKTSSYFVACEGLLYVRTEATTISNKGDSVNVYRRSAKVKDTEGETISPREISSNLGGFIFGWKEVLTLIRPEMLVYGNGTMRHMANGTVRVDAEFSRDSQHIQGFVEFVVGAGVEEMEVDLAALIFREETPWWEDISVTLSKVRFQLRPDLGEEIFNLSLLMRFRSLYAENVTMDLVLDGIVERRFNMTEIEMAFVDQTYALFDHFIQLNPGLHVLDLVLAGNVFVDEHNLSEEPVEITNVSLRVMRVAPGTAVEMVGSFIEDGGDYLLLDSNTTLVVEDLEVVADEETGWRTVHVVGGPGSSLDLVEPVSHEQVWFRIYCGEDVDLTVHGGELAYLYIEVEEYRWWTMGIGRPETKGRIDVEGLACGGLEVDCMMRDVRLVGVAADWYINCFAYENSSLEMNGCNGALWGGSVWGDFASVRICNCTFQSSESATLNIFAYYFQLEVRDCRFDGVHMSVQKEYQLNWTMEVTGCEFLGDGGVLSILWRRPSSQYLPNSWFPVPEGVIEGNRFVGPQTGLVLHNALFGELLGENDLADGARIFAWYLSDIRTRREDSMAQESSYIYFVEEDRMSSEFPLGQYGYEGHLEDQMFIDVTEDPSQALDPDPLHVVIVTRYDRYAVMGFGTVDPREDYTELTYPFWPTTDIFLREMLEADWPWPLKPPVE